MSAEQRHSDRRSPTRAAHAAPHVPCAAIADLPPPCYQARSAAARLPEVRRAAPVRAVALAAPNTTALLSRDTTMRTTNRPRWGWLGECLVPRPKIPAAAATRAASPPSTETVPTATINEGAREDLPQGSGTADIEGRDTSTACAAITSSAASPLRVATRGDELRSDAAMSGSTAPTSTSDAHDECKAYNDSDEGASPTDSGGERTLVVDGIDARMQQRERRAEQVEGADGLPSRSMRPAVEAR